MKYYTYKSETFSQAEFVGGQDSKGRTESWVVTVESLYWSETDSPERTFRAGDVLVGCEFKVKVQKHKDGQRFGAVQSAKFARTALDVDVLIHEAKQKALKSAAH